MKRLRLLSLLILACGQVLARAGEDPAPPFALADGDRVVLIGNTFIERDQEHGYLETLLTARDPDRDITFRNLGWSGDTVFGEARAGFGTAAEGFNHLKDHVLALRPTVLVVGYGANEAFAGPAGLSRFVDGLNRLLDVLTPAKAHLIFLSPLHQENRGRPLPDPSAHNKDLRLYADAIREVAARRGGRFIDLYDLLGAGAKWPITGPLTDNGIHLTSYGYWHAAQAVAAGLGLGPPRWKVVIDREGKARQSLGTTLAHIERDERGLRFEARDAMLPGLPIATDAPPGGLASWGPMPILQATGLPPGRYLLRIDGKPHAVADDKAWGAGVAIVDSPAYDQVERLRRLIVAKNRLYFYRWRPQNETYLFGFRKHEQGQNAREIPLFDPLVAAKEKEIAQVRVPVTHTYELVREREGEVGR